MLTNRNLSERAIKHIYQALLVEIQNGCDTVCMNTIGQRAGYSLRTTQYAFSELERQQRIIVERNRRGIASRYRIAP